MGAAADRSCSADEDADGDACYVAAEGSVVQGDVSSAAAWSAELDREVTSRQRQLRHRRLLFAAALAAAILGSLLVATHWALLRRVAAHSALTTALWLALASSTDNFAVGASLALAGGALPPWLNLSIALCNALGALASASVGGLLGSLAPRIAPLLAAAIFGWLAFEEVGSRQRGEDASPLVSAAADGLLWRLALPMTLNNLAGGVAGGAIGVGPGLAFACALLASVVMMATGHGHRPRRRRDAAAMRRPAPRRRRDVRRHGRGAGGRGPQDLALVRGALEIEV